MLLNYLESLWVAVAFAEAGEFEAAIEFTEAKVPDCTRIQEALEIL